MRISILIFIYTMHFAYLKSTRNFTILNQVVAEKTVHMCLIGVAEGKNEKEYHLYFHLHNTLSLPEGVHKI